MSLTPAWALLVVFGLLVAYRRLARAQRGKLPPGPPADPILGHLRTFPRDNHGETFYEWSKRYGDVLHLDLLGKSIIVLNSHEAANDLLDKRSANYSDRPDFPAFNLLGWDDMLVFQRYGSGFQLHRRLMQQPLMRQEVAIFRPVQTQQCHVLLKNLLANPEDFEAHIRRFTSAITLEMTYGHKVASDDDAYLEIADQVNIVSTIMSKCSVLELFPSAKHLPAWFPGAWFIRYANEHRHLIWEMASKPFQQVEEQLAAGTAQPSFVSMHLEDMERQGTRTDAATVAALKTAAAHMWTGGEETTWSTLLIFMLAAVRNPEAVRAAQAELDAVLGPGPARLPAFEDLDALPLVRGVVYETLRFHSALPLGIPHRAMADDVYRDMHIPRDATVLVNTTALARDPAVYSAPERFWPERYQAPHSEPPPTGLGFGFGRRVCPGRHLAEASLCIVVASVLAVFDVAPAKDAHGREVLPEVRFTQAITSHPEPFKCRIAPRSEQARRLVEDL
ncbi:cytochrome P450 [Phanerochaete sordida]|uniref:Cytochrome P450 n=1 Tax=Phanerochaete sordida TaxID=48140 RepID=A0A9P3G0P2_9APHY|nr:cytochrome P450 [Phanerochaete sordida]